jgi:hypothetical protein
VKTYSKYIANYYNIKKYNDDIYKIIYCKMPIKRAGFEEENKYKRSRYVNAEKLGNNVARARTRVFEYAICNNFEYFITLTINGDLLDRYDLKGYIKNLGQFIRDYRKKYGADIQYLLIPEKHINGAWHMHGLIKGIPKDHLHKNEYGYLDWQNYKNKFGFCSIDKVRNQEAVSKYITKYLRKSFDTGGGVTEKESKLYYCSRGLKKPQKMKEGTLTTGQMNKIPFEYENDYVRTVILTSEQFEQVASMLDENIIS